MIDKQTNTRLKRFAQVARRYLIDHVNTKLSEVLCPDSDAATYEKTKPLYNALLKEVLGVGGEGLGVRALGVRESGSGEAALKPNTQNLTPLAERVAYTWFNRFTALRYMDIKHFSPVRIISPRGSDSLPQILADAKMGIIDVSLINSEDRQRVLGLLSGTLESTYHKGDAQSEAYRILLLGACNHFGKSLPFLFKPIKDWMELLLPDDLLGEHGILAMIREVMTKETCEDVEVIGWLYQYYISEKKDEVFAKVKNGKKVQSEDIPAVTQLFTPHWIVKYMVQNSLGRLWLQNHPNSNLKAKMEYYVAQDSDPGVANSDLPHADSEIGIPVNSPEEIKFCDPCCGSGHILTYAFDLLYDIYSEEGYDPIDIPRLIIAKNLFGIEIDERASELAAFALSMKARDKDRQWFSRAIDPHICRLENISFAELEIDPFLDRCGRDVFTLNFERMLSQFEHADTFGSLIVPCEQDIEGIRELLNSKDFSGDVFLAPTHNKVLKLIDQADYLSTKYQVVVTNPPYMGKGMSDELSKYLSDNYTDAKSDLFSAFILRNLNLCLPGGQLGFMTPFVWMFISSYEKLRKHLIKHTCITSLIQLEYSGFDGATVPICTFTLENSVNPKHRGGYIKLSDFRGSENQAPRTLEAIANPECGWFFRCATSDFAKIPGAPIAYWVSKATISAFDGSITIGSTSSPRQGLASSDNDRFLRLWFEVSQDKSCKQAHDQASATLSKAKWFPYNKGGLYRKWYGNNEYYINWEDNGHEVMTLAAKLYGSPTRTIKNIQFYFRESITWSALSSAKISLRYSPTGFLFDTTGQCIFTKDSPTLYNYMALLNTPVTELFLTILSPTLHFNSGVVAIIPVKMPITSPKNDVELLVLVEKQDWDSYETSWDFQQLPLLGFRGQGLGVRGSEALKPNTYKLTPSIRECYAKLREQWIEMTLKMQELEEENNRIFIEAYGMQDELSPEVPLKEITLTCNPYYRYGVDSVVTGDSFQVSAEDGTCSKDSISSSTTPNQALTANAKLTLDDHLINNFKQGRREFPMRKDVEDRLLADTMKELISYAVGCMFGRFSLEKPGLILANQGETVEDYFDKVTGYRLQASGEGELSPNTCHLTPDSDNVIPILEGEWFIDDIVSRFSEFLRIVFGAEKYSENISFIEEAIGKDVRSYFIKDFYTDHVKRYKKRPIYWLFSSPKGSFNALIYMHRYTPDTVSIMLNGYLREYIHKLRAKVSQLEHQLNAGDQSEREKMLTRKEIDRQKDVITELEAWESKVILPLAEKRIEIDIDDGVKVNYAKFGAALKSF